MNFDDNVELVPILPKTHFSAYIFGQSGSGKSYYTLHYCLEYKRMYPKRNVYLFSGCQDKETSADATINNSGQGAFTYCLLETLKTNLQENTQRFKNGTLKLRNILKEINCRLDINGFEQNTQLSLSKKENFESTLNL